MEWISVKDRLPENEQEVFVCCNRGGYRFCCPAIYEDGTVLTQDSAWNWYELYNYGTYSEEKDDYFVPQGWWENRHFAPDDVYNCPVDCEVTDWMPLPELPEEDRVPVVPGRWEYSAQTIHTQSLMRCSICGWWTLDPSVDGAYHYCPNCGKKMDGDTQERKENMK